MDDGSLRIHFLNVGHGDCTIIEHPSGRLSVIDINNGSKVDQDSYKEMMEVLKPRQLARAAVSGGLVGAALATRNPYAIGGSLIASALLNDDEPRYKENNGLAEAGYGRLITNPVEYLENLCEAQGRKKTIFRYIQTHPDMDHMRGLASLLEHNFEIINFWDTETTKTTPNFSKVFEDDKSDWEAYQRLRRGDEGASIHIKRRGNSGTYWSEGPGDGDYGDGIEILSPTKEIARLANANDKHNNHSYVLRIKHAGCSVILGGDAEESVWEELVNIYGDGLKCDVLKASHHGRDSGYHQSAVSKMNPGLTVVSVGKKPSTDASSKYNNYSSKVLSTRWAGNIILKISADGRATYETEYEV